MNNTITIRQARHNDLNSIVEIENLSFDSDKFSVQQFDYLIKKANGKFYVAEYKGVVLGYISLLLRRQSTNVRVYGIAVHPDARGKKIAQQLMDAAKYFACSHKLKTISLEVKTNNFAAIQLYKKNSFIAISTRSIYYSDGTDAYYMKLSIS